MDPATIALVASLIRQFGPLLFEELEKAAAKDARRVYTESEIQIAIDRATQRMQHESGTKP